MTRSASSRIRGRFLEKLVEIRTNAGLTQVALAKRLGRPQSFVSKFENGERRLDVIEFIEIARALGADPANLVSDLDRA